MFRYNQPFCVVGSWKTFQKSCYYFAVSPGIDLMVGVPMAVCIRFFVASHCLLSDVSCTAHLPSLLLHNMRSQPMHEDAAPVNVSFCVISWFAKTDCSPFVPLLSNTHNFTTSTTPSQHVL
jgi:hypothetical protein